MDADEVTIDVLGPDDWRDLRAIRLEAFRRAPAAFSTTYAEALARPDEDWRERLASARSIHLAARSRGCPVGMVGGHLTSDEGDPTVGVVFGMYVREAYRGQGIGRRLLLRLLDRFAAAPAIAVVRLWVRPSQRPALRLYASLGFRVVGEEEDGSGRELIMELRSRGS
jgi:ribosomal protein S18 acetylase RimI-like enzyme